MRFGRRDPGLCPICGEAHTACTASRGPITAVQLPARDAASTSATVPLEAERVQTTLPAGRFTSGTYRGAKKRSR